MEYEENIHPTAIIHPNSKIHSTVKIGPYTSIGEFVELGEGTEVGNFVTITGHTKIGQFNKIYHSSSLGERPQDMKFANEITYLEIGNRNTIREFCTFNTGTIQDKGITKVGDDNWIMAYVHIAHDCHVGNNTIFANNASLAGHVDVDDYVILGGFTGVHQFCKIGSHSITCGGAMINKDVPPCIRTTSGWNPAPSGLNLEGLKRRGFSTQSITTLKMAYKIIYRDGNTIDEAKILLIDLAKTSPEINLFIDFIDKSNRGLIR